MSMTFEDKLNDFILKYYPHIFGSLFLAEWFIANFRIRTVIHDVAFYVFLITLLWVAQNIRKQDR